MTSVTVTKRTNNIWEETNVFQNSCLAVGGKIGNSALGNTSLDENLAANMVLNMVQKPSLQFRSMDQPTYRHIWRPPKAAVRHSQVAWKKSCPSPPARFYIYYLLLLLLGWRATVSSSKVKVSALRLCSTQKIPVQIPCVRPSARMDRCRRSCRF